MWDYTYDRKNERQSDTEAYKSGHDLGQPIEFFTAIDIVPH